MRHTAWVPAVNVPVGSRSRFLIPLNLSTNALARELNVPPNRITAITDAGRPRSVTADTAIRPGGYFGATPQFWLNPRSDYELSLALAEPRSGINGKARPRAA